jgi:hypothetical protein
MTAAPFGGIETRKYPIAYWLAMPVVRLVGGDVAQTGGDLSQGVLGRPTGEPM